jgi:hypothetical protein
LGVITLKIDDEIESKLRKKIGLTKGAARGAISESVEEAINDWLKKEEEEQPRSRSKHNEVSDRRYVAMRSRKKVAVATSLESLSEKLRERGVDPRDVTIESIPAIASEIRLGLPTVKFESEVQ